MGRQFGTIIPPEKGRTSRYHRIRFTIDGKSYKRSRYYREADGRLKSIESEPEGRRVLDGILADVSRGRTAKAILASLDGPRDVVGKPKRTAPTFRKVGEQWLDALPNRKVKPVRPATVAFYRKKWNAHIDDLEFADEPIDSVTRAHVRRALDRLASSSLAGSTVNKIHSMASQVFAYWISRGNLSQQNPALGIARNSETGNKRDVKCDREQLRWLLDNADAVCSDYLLHFLYVAILSGARHGEIRKLTWRDVSDKGIYIHAETSKGKESRLVPAIPELRDTLAERRKAWAMKSGGRDGFVFSSVRDVSKPMGEGFIYSRWRELVDAGVKAGKFAKRRGSAGAKHERLWIHDLRRSFATEIIGEHAASHTIKGILGHRHIATTERYLSATTRGAADAMERAGSSWSSERKDGDAKTG